METQGKPPKPPPRKFRLETKADVLHYLGETVRSLRRLVVTEKLDAIRVNRAKALVYSLSTMAELLDVQALEAVTDEALRNEVLRRRAVELGRPALGAGAESPEPH